MLTRLGFSVGFSLVSRSPNNERWYECQKSTAIERLTSLASTITLSHSFSHGFNKFRDLIERFDLDVSRDRSRT